MILAVIIVAAIMFAIWRLVNKNELQNNDNVNYVKIEPKEENKGTDDNG